MFPFLSLVSFYESYIRHCYSTSGLYHRTIEIETEPKTIIEFWGPEPNRTKPDKPNLLLIHGFGPIAIWQWRRQVQALAPQFNIYVPNLLFFGGSTTTSSDRTEVFQASCLGKLAEKLNLDKFHVAGTSYGGFVTYHMARMWPERVEKVVIASSGVNLRKSNNELLLKKAKLEKIEELMLPGNATQLRTLMDLAVHKKLTMAPDFLLNDIINKLYKENRMQKLELLKGLTLGRDDNPKLSELSQDVLLLWGEYDQLFPVEMATELKGLLGKKVKLEIMKNTSHVPQIEDARTFNEIVKNFLCGMSS